MPGRGSRRALWISIALGVLLLAMFLPPFVNVNRYRNRVTSAIGNALGRQVTVSNIELKLLPRPGMVLSTFVVADDPSYGAEPMLRAETVTAYLRVSSLWRGRLEIGTLALDNPSLNLVRRADGHWNLEELVERTSQVPSAPTAKPSPGVEAPLSLRRGHSRTNQLQARPGEEGLRVLRRGLRTLAGVGERMGRPAGGASRALGRSGERHRHSQDGGPVSASARVSGILRSISRSTSPRASSARSRP